MRVLFTSLFVVGLALAASSAVAENKITLRAENQPFGEVLTEISEQSGIPIILSSNSLPISAEPVQFSVKNSDVEKALDRALSGYDYTLSWHADAGQFTKVLVTVHERKEGLVRVASKVAEPPVIPVDLGAETDRVPIDYSKIPAFPPDSGVEISAQELKDLLAKSRKNMTWDKIPAFPPGPNGEKGISTKALRDELGVVN